MIAYLAAYLNGLVSVSVDNDHGGMPTFSPWVEVSLPSTHDSITFVPSQGRRWRYVAGVRH